MSRQDRRKAQIEKSKEAQSKKAAPPPNIQSEKKTRSAILKILLDGFAAWALKAAGMPVAWRWAAWLICYVLLLEFLRGLVGPFNRLPFKVKFLVETALVVAFC